MSDSQSPRDWIVPSWHPDLGDSALELEHLRGFSLALLSAKPSARVALETPEPGLMYVNIKLPDGTVAEVYSVPSSDNSSKRRFAIFIAPGTPEEDEIYAETLPLAVKCFGERLKNNRHAE